MNKRWMAAIVALIMASLMIVGSAVSVAAQTPELVIWMREGYPINPELIGDAFERDYQMKVRVEYMPMETIRERFFAEGASGTGPDIIMDSDDLLDRFLNEVGLDPVDLGNRTTEYVPFAIQAFSRDNHLYAVPFALENLAFVRNTRLVPDMPPTWDDVFIISVTLQASGAAEYGFVLPEGDFYHFFPILSAFGGYTFGQNEDGTYNPADLGLGNEGTLAALTWVQQMAQTNALPPHMDWGTAHEAMSSEKAAMIITGPWAIGQFEEAGIPFAVSAIPAGVQPGRPWVHVQGFMINAHSQNKDAAQRFVSEYLASQPAMQMMYESVRLVPAHLGVFEQVDDPVVLGFADALQYGLRIPTIPEMDAVWNEMPNAIQRVREGQQDPKTALDQALTAIQQQLGQ